MFGKSKKLKQSMACMAIAVSMASAGSASAAVLTFDDITTNTGFTALNGTSYGGLNWSDDWFALHTPTYTVSGYQTGTVSGDYVALNGFGTDVEITNGTFDFMGTYLAAAWNDGLQVEVKGFSGGIETYMTTVTVDTAGPTWFNFNMTGVDKLSFRSFGGVQNGSLNGSGSHFAMDNFTYNVAATGVPAPGPLGLLALSGALLLGLRRRG